MIIAPADLETYQGNAKLKHNLVVKEVLGGGNETNWVNRPEIENKEFKEALLQSLETAQLLNPNPPGKYTLLAKLVYVDRPDWGLDMTATVTAKYIVVEDATNREMYNEIIRTFHTATMGEAFGGMTRLQLALEGAARKNITKFISDLYQLE